MLKVFMLLAPIIALLAGCEDVRHKATGEWSGTMRKGNIHVDVGQVYIREDRITMPAIGMSFGDLEFNEVGNSLRIKEKGAEDLSSIGSARSRYTSGLIELLGNGRAVLTINRISGSIILVRS